MTTANVTEGRTMTYTPIKYAICGQTFWAVERDDGLIHTYCTDQEHAKAICLYLNTGEPYAD